MFGCTISFKSKNFRQFTFIALYGTKLTTFAFHIGDDLLAGSSLKTLIVKEIILNKH